MTLSFSLFFNEEQKTMCDQLINRIKPRLDKIDKEWDELGSEEWWLSHKIKVIEGVLSRKNLSEERRAYNQKKRIELKTAHIKVQERLERLKKYHKKVLQHGYNAVLRAYEAADMASRKGTTNAG